MSRLARMSSAGLPLTRTRSARSPGALSPTIREVEHRCIAEVAEPNASSAVSLASIQVFRFAMQRGARRSSGIPCISSSQDRRVRSHTSGNSVDRDHTSPFEPMVYVVLQLPGVGRQNIRTKFGITQDAPANFPRA
jgi:hypothetical protein